MANKFLDLLGLSEFLNQLKALFVTKNEIGSTQADWNVTDETSNSYIKNKPTSMPASDVSSWAKASKKPSYTALEIGADPSGSASNALSSAKTYTDEKISGLINGAPETLDTLKEVADAITENETVVDALNSAIGTKANTSDLTSHVNNSTVHITSSERTKWNAAKTHADAAHAPSNAERNTIVSVKKNGMALTPDSSRAINLEIPDDYIISGLQTTTSNADAGSNIYTFTKSDGTTSTFTVRNGSKGSTGNTGSTGTRGSIINWGTAITGTSTTATIFSSSGLTSSLVNDLYINTNTWNIYQCTIAGAASVAKWTYKGNIKGATGAKGNTGAAGANGTSVTISSTSVTYQASTSGTTVPTGTWSTTIPSVAAGSYLWTKTVVTYSTGTSITSYSVGKMGTTGVKGADGVSISSVAQTTTSTADAGTNVITVTLSNGTTSTFNVKNGSKGSTGSTGTRGSLWYSGTAITGTSTTATIFSSSGITSALVNDYYLNTSTGYVYQCTIAGSASVAKWVYKGSIRGAAGTNATTTAVASATNNGLMSSGDFTKLSKVTATEMGYLSGITSSVQTQINGIANEVLSASEPTNQKNGDYWITEY